MPLFLPLIAAPRAIRPSTHRLHEINSSNANGDDRDAHIVSAKGVAQCPALLTTFWPPLFNEQNLAQWLRLPSSSVFARSSGEAPSSFAAIHRDRLSMAPVENFFLEPTSMAIVSTYIRL
jgi:hypothetical protein